MGKIIIGDAEIETKDKTITDVMLESIKDVKLNILDFAKLEDKLLSKLANKNLQA